MKKRIALFILAAGSVLLLLSRENGDSVSWSKENAVSSKPPITEYVKKYAGNETGTKSTSRISLRGDSNRATEAPAILTEKMDSFFRKIPRKSALAELTHADVHTTPRPVLRAGELLAEMRELFLNTPHPINAELDFYLRCSQETDFLDSVRAVCAARAKKTYRDATGKKLSAVIFEPRIAALSDKINL